MYEYVLSFILQPEPYVAIGEIKWVLVEQITRVIIKILTKEIEF